MSDAGDSKPKRCKGEDSRTIDRDDVKHSKAERSCSENSGDESGSPRGHHRESNKSKETLSKQDFIHVRARRGQATDSHSLAERVRILPHPDSSNDGRCIIPSCGLPPYWESSEKLHIHKSPEMSDLGYIACYIHRFVGRRSVRG